MPLSVQHVLAECPRLDEEVFPEQTLLSVEEMSIILAEPRSGTFDINKLILFLQSCYYNSQDMR